MLRKILAGTPSDLCSLVQATKVKTRSLYRISLHGLDSKVGHCPCAHALLPIANGKPASVYHRILSLQLTTNQPVPNTGYFLSPCHPPPPPLLLSKRALSFTLGMTEYSADIGGGDFLEALLLASSAILYFHTVVSVLI